LEKSLPLATKLFPLEEKFKEVSDEKRISGKVMFEALSKLKVARDDVKAIITELDEINNKQ
jgi:hypothetical protein